MILASSAAAGCQEGAFLLGPIFIREWLTVPRRIGHYVGRTAYLAFLWITAFTAFQTIVGFNRPSTLGDNAHFALFLFQIITVLQLLLIPFFAAISAASAITQEKDRRTFVLLLLTDLRSYEIVLGKLLGSLLPIALLLLGMLPVLSLLMLLGGIAPAQVVQAGLVIGAASLAAGAVGNLIALWREKTFQVLALTVLFLVLYLCLVNGLTLLPQSAWFAPDYWQQRLDPFRALQSVMSASGDAEAGLSPVYGFVLMMLAFSIALVATGINRLRVWNPSGEPIMQRERPEDEDKNRALAHAAPGLARQVWANPILWREIRTRAYGRRPLLVKLAFVVALALICSYALAPLWAEGGRPAFFAAYGLVPVSIIGLLLLSAQAVTAITSERDCGALDLLLVTDLTPQEFIYGKLLGILWNTKEFVLPPIILAAVYAAFGALATPPVRHPELLASKNIQAYLAVAGDTLVVMAFTMVLGLHVALRNEQSRVAILLTLATVFFLSVGTLMCIYLILINGRFEVQWTSFILYVAAAIGGLWWVLNGERPSAALNLASGLCPIAVFYTVVNILVARPGSEESTDPLIPFVVIAGAFGFAVAAMVVPLVSEFDVALGRTTAAE